MAANPEKIGRYQVLERVGRGGMGVLYRGIDPVLDREVAIKLMLTDFSEDEEQLRPRFYREARAAARLQHRNIVTIFEFAEEGNTPYIVMEFLRGMSLADRAKSAPPLTVDEKLDIVAQLCTGLSYAHELGVVHRDVKPANIFLLADGTVKLLDFGIAKVTTSTLTRQGDVLGSASYMSPEQVSGSDSVDGRADVFSAGVVLYELLAGRRPFHADAPTAIIMKIMHEDPPSLAGIVPGLPADLVAAVNRALAKNPNDRFGTSAEMARELQSIRKTLQSGDDQAFDETRFASTSVIRAYQKDIESRTPRAPASPPAAAGAGGGAAARKWLVPAGVVVLVLGAAALAVTLGRSTAPAASATAAPAAAGAVPPGGTASRTPAPPVVAGGSEAAPKETEARAPAPEGTPIQVASDPAGAAILLDGRDTRQTTPASVLVSGAGPHRLRLSKPGFQSTDARLSEADLKKGSLSYALTKAEAATIPLSLSGPYPFAVVDGSKTISPPSESHELNVAVGKTLRLVAPEYLLSEQVHVEGAPGRRLEIQAPALGKLNVLTKYETCQVRINGRDLGYPPVNNQPIAAGTYRIDLICPNGQNQVGTVVVAPGQATTARIQ